MWREQNACLVFWIAHFIYSFAYLFTILIILFCFYWSIITLQCCVSFHWTTKWISYMYTYIPFCLDLPPSTLHLTHLGQDRALHWASCAGQLTLIGIFYSYPSPSIYSVSTFQQVWKSLILAIGITQGTRHLSRSPYLTWVHFWLMVTQFAF